LNGSALSQQHVKTEIRGDKHRSQDESRFAYSLSKVAPSLRAQCPHDSGRYDWADDSAKHEDQNEQKGKRHA
jgi:hypothetical protein